MPYKTRKDVPKTPSTMAAIKSLFFNAKQQMAGITPEPITNLFPKVDPEIDGEDCDHDCSSCVVKLPKGFKIDEEDQLYGHVKGWSTHVLVATGKTDWVRDVADEKGSVMEAIEKKADIKPSNGVYLPCICHCTLANRPAETHVIRLKYSYPEPSYRLLRADHCPSSSSLYHNRKRLAQKRKYPNVRVRQQSTYKHNTSWTNLSSRIIARPSTYCRTINVSTMSTPSSDPVMFAKDTRCTMRSICSITTERTRATPESLWTVSGPRR